MEYKEYGHWSENGREYVITERKTPRHWYNYYFNDTVGGQVDHLLCFRLEADSGGT